MTVVHTAYWSSSRTRQQCCRLEGFSRIIELHMSRPMVKNHVSSKKVFGYNVIRRTTYQSWSRVYRRLPRQSHLAQHLPHHYRRKVQAKNPFQHQLNVSVQMTKYGTTRRSTLPKTQNPKKIGTMSGYGATRHFPKCLNGYKNSRRISWMT